MPDFAVSTVFKAKDRVTRAFVRMNRAAGLFGTGSSRAFRRASRQGSVFGKIVKGILTAGAIRKGVSLLSSGLREATTEFIAFDDAIKSSTARFGDLNVNTVAGKKAISDLRKISRKLGAETEFTATQAAQGLEFFALAGLSVKESIALLPGTVNLATAANVDLARAVEIGVKSLGAFGIESKNTVELQKNFIRVTDLLAKASTSAVLDFDTLFESVRAGASIFTDAGQSMETFTALVGKMAKNAVDGESAGTALRNVMLRLAAPTPQARSALGVLGVEVADKKGKFRDFIDVIADFEKGMKTVSEVERLAALDIIFGKKAITGFNAVLKVGAKGLREYREGLKDASGSSQRMADIMRGSLGKRLAALKSSAIEVGFKFLEAFKKNGVGAIKAATNALRRFDVQPVINSVKTMIDIFKEAFEAAKPLRGFISGLTKSDVISILKVAAAFKAVSIGIGLINFAIAASPIGLLLTSLAAASAALILIEKKYRSIGKLIDSVSKKISGPLLKTGDVFKKILTSSKAKGITGFFERNLPKQSVGEAPNRQREVIPPNRQDLFRSRQEVDVSGRIDLAGAPEGSKFELFQAPRIDTAVLGANP